MAKKVSNGGMKTKRIVGDIVSHTLLVVMCIIWVLPFVYLVAHSFRGESSGSYSKFFFPEQWTLDNYINLFTKTDTLDFKRMFLNTLFISSCACVISTFMVLSVAYCTSRIKWKMRKPYMNMAMIIGLFPGFMGMVALYFLLKAMGLTEGNMVPLALILCFSAGAGAGFYVMKGYMDTIPKALDEAAYMDGATRFQTYIKIILPLCKPMIVYQIITSFMGPWMDFILGKMICRTNIKYFTVSIGLWTMLDMDHINTWFTRFCAGAVCVAIPISVLYIITQRFYQEAMSGSVKG
jgi:arabinogalactan oligomer/maltooligosaccharide transport system permease protein